MRPRSTLLRALCAACAAATIAAAPAAAAPVTVSTGAGTSCTIDAGARLGTGLLVRPVDFSGSIVCDVSPTAAANPTIEGLLSYGGELGLVQLGAKRGARTAAVIDEDPGDEIARGYRCEVAQGADCGDAGRGDAIALVTYTTRFSVTLTPPPGETFVSLPAGCIAFDEGSEVGCSAASVFTGKL